MAKTAKKASKKVLKKTGKKGKGRFIVIDGVDGGGKATQTRLLVEALRKQGNKVETIDFPQYHKNFFGALIGECLRGDHGDFLAIDPKIISPLYACDRVESSPQIRKWLDEGTIVVADRFTSANQIHQGGKCKTDKERKEFLTWLDKMEHEILGVPRPDVIVYLSLPVKISLELIASREEKNKKDKKLKAHRSYLKGKRDLAELDVDHLEASRQSALRIIKSKNNWKKIDCYVRGKLLSVEEIHAKVLGAIK